jgi:hypothetical protein
VEDQYKKDVQISVNSVMDAYKTAKTAATTARTAHNKSTYAYIVLGKALLNCRMVLRSGFKDHITEPKTGISDKQVRRYMRFVACPTTYDDLAKKPNAEDDVNLKVHPYIDKIKEHYLDTLNDQSMNKIDRMKKLDTYADFKAVCKGNDDKYDAMLKKQTADKKAADEKEVASITEGYIKDGLSEKEIERFRSGGGDAINEIIKIRKENKELGDRIEEDSDTLYDYEQRLKVFEETLKKLQDEYPDMQKLLKSMKEQIKDKAA